MTQAAPIQASETDPQKSLYRLLIVDDHPIVRSGIAQLLTKYANIEICGEADSALAALREMRALNPDIALLDVSMPGTNGIELIKMMLSERPDLLILMLSMHDESLFAL